MPKYAKPLLGQVTLPLNYDLGPSWQLSSSVSLTGASVGGVKLVFFAICPECAREVEAIECYTMMANATQEFAAVVSYVIVDKCFRLKPCGHVVKQVNVRQVSPSPLGP